MTPLLKKRNFISKIESLDGFSTPKIEMEQYTTDAISTADLIYYVGVDNRDIVGNVIIDIGAGTGKLGLSALLFGGMGLVAIENEKDAINIFKKNAKSLDFLDRILLLEYDVQKIYDDEENFQNIIEDINQKIMNFQKETVFLHQTDSAFWNNIEESDQKLEKICIMNPPFGVHKKGADRAFLKLAMKISDVIYSIHLSSKKNREFLRRFIKKNGWKIETMHSQKLVIKGQYKFHKKPQKEIITDVYKIVRS